MPCVLFVGLPLLPATKEGERASRSWEEGRKGGRGIDNWVGGGAGREENGRKGLQQVGRE